MALDANEAFPGGSARDSVGKCEPSGKTDNKACGDKGIFPLENTKHLLARAISPVFTA